MTARNWTASRIGRALASAMPRAMLCAGAAVLLAALLPAHAQQAPRLMVVFDGSGSMWGRLSASPRSKLVAMRQELTRALREKRPDVAVGLTTFGARSGASCTSAATPLAAKPGQIGQLERLLTSFNPQGRGPVVLGLKTAIEALGGSGAPARLLLIHDSLDNCSQDVCALARDLAAGQSRVVVDVLSLGLKRKDRATMACLTKATGGRLVNAATMDAAIAGIDTIVASLDNTRPRAGPSIAGRPTRAAPAKPAPQSAGLTLTARLAGTKTVIPHGISWQIKSHSKLSPPVNRTVHRATLDIALPPATYEVILNTELQRLRKQIDVQEGVRQALVFEVVGGLVEVIAPAAPSAATSSAEDGAVSVVRTAESGGKPAGVVWTGPASAARALLLEDGAYRISVSNGLSQVSRAIDVAAGSSQKIGFVAAPAQLTVVTAGLSPAQAVNADIRIARKLVDEPARRPVVARSAAPRATFTLPAGPYYVTLRAHGTETTSLVILAAGEAVTHTPRLRQMALRVTSHVANGPKLDGTDLRYRVWRADALLEPIAVSRKARPVFHLAPGKYRIESRIGHQNAVMIREFDVGSAGAGSLELRHGAGKVSFAVPKDLRDQRLIAYWEVLDPDNRLIWRSFEPYPTATLNAGAYKVTMQTKDETFSTKFKVIAGRSDTVALHKN
ncbi:MAG: hypothetical protein ACR2PI_20570 [Hyphomicrobiaceae bacterium]